MPNFISDGLEIAYVDEGEGEPILLIHGFGSSLAVNWRSTNWIDTLVRDGRRVIAMDVRGHGNSAKPRETALYRPALLAADAGRLVDHLGIGRIDVMGYSMGARIATFLALARPEIVRSLIIGGLGIALVEGLGGQEEIAAALEAPPGTEIASAVGRSYRRFGEATKSDLPALDARERERDRHRAAHHAGAGGGWRSRRGGRLAGPAGSADPGGGGARHSRAGPHAGDRRQGLQAGRSRLPQGAAVKRERISRRRPCGNTNCS